MSRKLGRVLVGFHGVLSGSSEGSSAAQRAYQALTSVTSTIASGAWRFTVLLHQPRVASKPICCLASWMHSSAPQRSKYRWTISSSGTSAWVAYTIYKEMERRLAEAGLTMSPKRAIELCQTMYEMSFTLPNNPQERRILPSE